jgi:hypothetical protein
MLRVETNRKLNQWKNSFPQSILIIEIKMLKTGAMWTLNLEEAKVLILWEKYAMQLSVMKRKDSNKD